MIKILGGFVETFYSFSKNKNGGRFESDRLLK